MTMDDSIYTKYQNIVKGVARRYAGPFGMTYDDIEQQLWENLIYKVNVKGKTLTPGLVGRMCYDKAVDIYRHQRKYYDSTCSIAGQDYYTFEEESGSNQSSKIQSVKLKGYDDIEVILNVINLYEKGSKERTYIVSKLYNEGLIDKEIMDIDDELITPKDGDTESDYQGLLGFNNRKLSGSWISKKNKMRFEIYKKLFKIESAEDYYKFVISRMISRLYNHKNKICWYCYLIKDERLKALYMNKKEYILEAYEMHGKDKFYKIVDKDGYTGFIMKNDKAKQLMKEHDWKLDETDNIIK